MNFLDTILEFEHIIIFVVGVISAGVIGGLATYWSRSVITKELILKLERRQNDIPVEIDRRRLPKDSRKTTECRNK